MPLSTRERLRSTESKDVNINRRFFDNCKRMDRRAAGQWTACRAACPCKGRADTSKKA